MWFPYLSATRNFLMHKSEFKQYLQTDKGQACLAISTLTGPNPLLTLRLLTFSVWRMSHWEWVGSLSFSGPRPEDLQVWLPTLSIRVTWRVSLKKQTPTHTCVSHNETVSISISKVDYLCTLKCGLEAYTKNLIIHASRTGKAALLTKSCLNL